MSEIEIVTTFHPAGWGCYGRRFVETFLEHVSPPFRLHVFLEGQDPPLQHEQIVWRDLKDDPEHELFCSRYSGPQYNSRTDWNEMPVKFGHKVFAITSPHLPNSGWRVWVDADVEWVRHVDRRVLESLLPPDKSLTFLGRKGWMRAGQRAYTECGFVGYNLDRSATPVLREMRALYTSGELFSLGPHNQHDSYAFDFCRARTATPTSEEHNLSAHLPPNTFHPWEHTPLQLYLRHHKGPRRKSIAYGSVT